MRLWNVLTYVDWVHDCSHFETAWNCSVIFGAKLLTQNPRGGWLVKKQDRDVLFWYMLFPGSLSTVQKLCFCHILKALFSYEFLQQRWVKQVFKSERAVKQRTINWAINKNDKKMNFQLIDNPILLTILWMKNCTSAFFSNFLLYQINFKLDLDLLWKFMKRWLQLYCFLLFIYFPFSWLDIPHFYFSLTFLMIRIIVEGPGEQL